MEFSNISNPPSLDITTRLLCLHFVSEIPYTLIPSVMFKLIEILREDHEHVRNTTEDYEQDIAKLIYDLPSFNSGYVKAGFIFLTSLLCIIFSFIIKEHKICVQLVSKYISSHIFHIVLGILIGRLDIYLSSQG